MAQLGVFNSVRVNVGTHFPDGTVLSAYRADAFPVGHRGSPMGTAVATATVEEGIAFFQNRPEPGVTTGDLVDGLTYVAAGQVGGEWRYINFAMQPQRQEDPRSDTEAPAGTMVDSPNYYIGYNPSVDLYSADTNKWLTLTFALVTDRGGGNRLHLPALNLTGIDPPELVFRGSGPDNTAPYGPNDDGTDLAAAGIGRGLGRCTWQAATRHQRVTGWAAHNGVHAAEEAREDVLTVQLASEHTFPTDTITITGDLDATPAHNGGDDFPFHGAGQIRCGGNRISYSQRSDTQFFGCSGGTGTFPAGQSVTQNQVANAGRWHLHTSSIGTNDRANRVRLNEDGSLLFGEMAILENSREGFAVFQGGNVVVKQSKAPSNFAAEVIGTPGTATITYKLVGNTADFKQTEAASVTITDAPNTLSATNYVKLSWQHPSASIETWDVIRSATDGTPSDTGPIVYRRASNKDRQIGLGTGAADYGQTPVAVNEVQTVVVRNATDGTFRLGFDGGESNAIDFDGDAAHVLTKLENIAALEDNIEVEDVGVSAWRITFVNDLAGENVSQLIPRNPILAGPDNEDGLVNEPEVEEGEEPPIDVPNPSIVIRTRVQGGPVAYVLPTRDSTGDLIVEGAPAFHGANPVAQSAAYTPTNVTTDRAYNANATTTDELADVLGTLISDLQDTGIVG